MKIDIDDFIKDILLDGNKKKENYIKNNWPYFHNQILIYAKKNNIEYDKFLEILYLFVNNFIEPQKCKNSNCNNSTKFTSFSEGYKIYCCRQCQDETLSKIRSSIGKEGSINREIEKRYPDENVEELKLNSEKWSTDNNLIFKSLQEKVFIFKNNITKKVECRNINCNNLVNFENIKEGYYNYCSKECSHTCDILKEEVKMNFRNKTGYDNPLQNPEILIKKLETQRNNK